MALLPIQLEPLRATREFELVLLPLEEPEPILGRAVTVLKIPDAAQDLQLVPVRGADGRCPDRLRVDVGMRHLRVVGTAALGAVLVDRDHAIERPVHAQAAVLGIDDQHLRLSRLGKEVRRLFPDPLDVVGLLADREPLLVTAVDFVVDGTSATGVWLPTNPHLPALDPAFDVHRDARAFPSEPPGPAPLAPNALLALRPHAPAVVPVGTEHARERRAV